MPSRSHGRAPPDSHDPQARTLYTETIAGPGTGEAIAFRFGKLLYRPAGTSTTEHDLEPGYHLAQGHDNAVNSGLRAIGAHAAADEDEHATTGPARHRMTEDWPRDSPDICDAHDPSR